ncbi:putative tubulin polyglutamylase TTLL2 [Holothuria leucospilota]|uniref:Tubulin polyglutamylase TTLL2 n=1 Tax=Holothuria leucospilota TaxID=206669 RepID=A0A9Q1BIS6_HOLLE|nr:putative tubulin polyglutamylase TTLL2 [Holothuria leucospilota]
MDFKQTRNGSAKSDKPLPPLVFRMNENGSGSETVRSVLLDRGWKEFVEGEQNENDWNLSWRNSRYRQCDYDDLMSWQRLNHFPKTTAITKKDMLARNMKRMKGVYGASVFNFTPLAFNLPNDYTKFVAEYTKIMDQNKKEENGKKEFWICKPADSSRGRGIFLFQNLSELTYDCSAVAQRYITNPCLIAGYKFDLRLYVLVTSFHPLTVYMYQEGIVRFSTEKYDLNSIGNLYSHLTNTSINKFSPSYTTDKERVGQGCKWTLTMLRNYFHQQNVDDEILWQKISNVVILTLLAQVTTVPKVTGAFELFGFDIMIDDRLKPWLLEVNFNPALTMDCPVDSVVKRGMLNEVINILGFDEEDGHRGGENYTRLKSKQYNSRPRHTRFVPRALPKTYLRKGVGQIKQAGKKVTNAGLVKKTKNSLEAKKSNGVAKSNSKTSIASDDDYDEEIAHACGIGADASSKPSTPAKPASPSKLMFKSPSMSKLTSRESSQDSLKLKGKDGKSSSIDDIWIPSIEESRKALASRRQMIRKREEQMNTLSNCLGNQNSTNSPLARVISANLHSGSSSSLTSTSQGDVSGSESKLGPPELKKGSPLVTRANGSPSRPTTSNQQGTAVVNHSQEDKHKSPQLNRASRASQAKGDRKKLDGQGHQSGSDVKSKVASSTRQSLYSKPGVGGSRWEQRGTTQGRNRGYEWPPEKVGDFTLIFPFNDATKRASYPTIDMRAVIKETQKELKRAICKSKAAKKVVTGTPPTVQKVSHGGRVDMVGREGTKCEDTHLDWAPLRSSTMTTVEA